ncbi:MAG TPA: bifunctional 4-hydroxy-2-oxoglutarate aldolase/2-dehydro-3-deoxy-phosphogluconate aldolase [Polyangia bacterium]
MEKAKVLSRIREGGLIPIVRTPTSDDALALSEALCAAGLTNLEITLTVPNALEVIRTLNQRYGEKVLIGAGSVLDVRSAEACIAAGATFIVSPGLDLETVAHCKKTGVAIFPGSLTPTEIITAWKAGADMVKVFPASAMGGASYIKAIKAPLPQIEMVPTGGVSIETAPAFIKAGAAALGVGGDLVDLEVIRSGRGHILGERAQRYIEVVRQARA